jgi:hypothetical protein
MKPKDEHKRMFPDIIAIVKNKRKALIIELNFNRTAAEALNTIKERKYLEGE